MRALRWSLLALLLGLPAQAAVFTVTKTADTLDGACDHDCSLREAVSAANIAPGVDVVRAPAGIYTLSRTGAGEDANATGDLDVTGELLLVGAGAGSTILDGFGADRVLHLRSDAEIYGVTIRNGKVSGPGGGIYINHGVLTITVLLHHSVVQGNRANDGGGIFVSTKLVMRESAVLDNHARSGGGIGGSSALIWLTNVTVANNFAELLGGGLSYQDDSSADQVGQSRSAPCEAGAWELAEPPVCVPGGPVLCLQEGRFRVTAGWRSGFLTQGDAQADPLTDDTGNFWFFSPDNLEVMVKVLDGCGLNQRWWVFTSGLTDVGVDLKVEDLETGRIWEHGHAAGTTYAPVLDTDAFPCTAVRQASAVSQAVETGPASAILVVTKTADTFDGICDHDCSLREAVAAANTRNGLGVIVAGPGVYELTREGRGEELSASGDLDVLEDLVILGSGAKRTVLDGGGIDRVLHVLSDARLEAHGITVRNGVALGSQPFDNGAGGGGGILGGSVTLVGCHVTGNRAEKLGGGLFAFEINATDTTFSDNEATSGGGLANFEKLRLSNVTVSGNRAAEVGGGLYLGLNDQAITQTTITGNQAASVGGLWVDCCLVCPSSDPFCHADFAMSRSILAGNQAAVHPDCPGVIEPVPDSYNVFGVDDKDCTPGPTDLAGTPAAPLDPRLTPLGDRGGPTPTHVPLPGSPAVDLVPPGLCTPSDQRGRPRPAGEGCDAGSVELLPSACQPDEQTLCLGGGDRFQVTARWTAQGKSEAGRAVPLRLDSGAFWFFDPANVELTVKVLDGCGLNDRFWIFLTGLTDVGVEVEVRDTATGRIWTHTHAAGTPLQPRLDTNALESCE